MRQSFRTGMLVAALGGLFASAAHGQDRVRIGVLNDQSGVFSTYQGIGSVIAAQMAVEDYGGKAAGKLALRHRLVVADRDEDGVFERREFQRFEIRIKRLEILQLQDTDQKSRGLLERGEIELPARIRPGRLGRPVALARRNFGDSSHR